MDLPDGLLLGRIIQGHAYFDKKSIEKSTGRLKPKYKLSNHKTIPEFDSYIFVVLTSNKDSCNARLTLEIEEVDWENKVGGYLHGSSYCDVRKHDVISTKDLLEKMKDRDNLFQCVAKLSDEKFGAFCGLCKLALKQPYVPTETKLILEQTTSAIATEMARKLGVL